MAGYTGIGPQMVTPRPGDCSGAFAVCATTGTMAAGLAGGAPVLSFRWGHASKLAVIERVTVAMNSLGTGFTAGVGAFDLIVARGFTASDSAGTALDLTTNTKTNRRQTAGQVSSLVTDLRASSTATLTAGTRTLDAYALSEIDFAIGTATNTVYLPTAELWSPDPLTWPLVLEKNEGVVIRATVPATGTWKGMFCLRWREVDAF